MHLKMFIEEKLIIFFVISLIAAKLMVCDFWTLPLKIRHAAQGGEGRGEAVQFAHLYLRSQSHLIGSERRSEEPGRGSTLT